MSVENFRDRYAPFQPPVVTVRKSGRTGAGGCWHEMGDGRFDKRARSSERRLIAELSEAGSSRTLATGSTAFERPAPVRFALVVLVASLMAGCALVEKVGSDGSIERSISLSPVSLVGASSDSRATRIAGLGLGIGQDSAVLGLYEMSAVRLDPECRIVVMPKNDVEVESFRRFLSETPSVCVVKD